MKCKKCKADIPDELHPVYCCYCGKKLQRERKKKDEIKIPTPRKRGQKWYVDLRREGVTVIEDTEAAAIAKAQAIRAGFVPVDKKHAALTLRKAIENYIADRDNSLSPATVRGYYTIQKNAFQAIMDTDIYSVPNWQAVVNKEAGRISAKTLKNEWGLVKTVLEKNEVAFDVSVLPQVVSVELPWLDYEQIKTFLDAVHGKPCEMAALFALHSLRRSELFALTPNHIKDDVIFVSGSIVYDKDYKPVSKKENKNTSSRRKVPIMIPRLAELLNQYDGAPDKPYMKCALNTPGNQINRICAANNLPLIGMHGLRRSFASLAYHLKWSERQTMETGGWADLETVHKIYIKLSKADEKQDIKNMKAFYNA
jgi:integrase